MILHKTPTVYFIEHAIKNDSVVCVPEMKTIWIKLIYNGTSQRHYLLCSMDHKFLKQDVINMLLKPCQNQHWREEVLAFENYVFRVAQVYFLTSATSTVQFSVRYIPQTAFRSDLATENKLSQLAGRKDH